MNNNSQIRLMSRNHFLPAIAAIFISGFLLGGCSSIDVHSDIDDSVDFSKLQSFDFFDPMGIEGGYNSPVYGEYFRESIENEMNLKGYRISTTPDFLVNVTIRADDKVSMHSYSQPYMTGHYYNRPGGAYGGSGMGVGISSGPSVSTEASVFIDFVDPEQKRMVWQGVAVFKASDDVASQLRNATFTVVNKVLVLYPHTAK